MMTVKRQNEILAGLCLKIRQAKQAGATVIRLVYRGPVTDSERARAIRETGSYPVKRKIGFNVIARAINMAKGR